MHSFSARRGKGSRHDLYVVFSAHLFSLSTDLFTQTYFNRLSRFVLDETSLDKDSSKDLAMVEYLTSIRDEEVIMIFPIDHLFNSD